jgi:hypothetical protein
MTVEELMEKLKAMPKDAAVWLDDEEMLADVELVPVDGFEPLVLLWSESKCK